ncbi:hypothetical protein Tco_0329415 [Tanacetum coccineum]
MCKSRSIKEVWKEFTSIFRPSSESQLLDIVRKSIICNFCHKKHKVAEMDSITKEPPQRELGSIKRLGTLREILTKAKTKDQVMPIDDYRLVLGLDFFEKDRAFPILATKTLVIHDNRVSQVITLKRRSKIQPLLSATQFKKASRERECLLATIRKSFNDETPTHPRPPRLFQKKKEWREEANETRTCLDNAVKRIKKWAENKQKEEMGQSKNTRSIGKDFPRRSQAGNKKNFYGNSKSTFVSTKMKARRGRHEIK